MELLVLRQLQQLPANLQQEVLDFIGYLLQKHQALPKHPESTPPLNEIEEAIRIVKMGCDMRSFGDALAYQIASRTERALPYHD